MRVTLVVVMMIGREPGRGTSCPRRMRFFIVRGALSSDSIDGITEGSCGDEAREGCNVVVDIDAALLSAAARSFWWSMVVMRDWRDVKLRRGSTR